MADAAELYRVLLDERGGEEALSLVERCIARQAAIALADETGASIREASALLDKLPAPRKKHEVDRLEVVFVNPSPEQQAEKLAHLERRLAEAEAAAATPRQATEQPADATEASTPPETPEQRRARAEAAAPIVRQSNVVQLTEMMLGGGVGRVDPWSNNTPLP
jgi:hypothetical protein